MLKDEPDGQQLSLVEHLDELRGRLIKSILAVLLTTALCLTFAPRILDYSIRPLRAALAERSRVETIVVYPDNDAAQTLADAVADHPRVRFRGRYDDLTDVAEAVKRAARSKAPVDLVLVSAQSIEDDGALMSDLLEGIEPTPYVAYLVESAKDPAVPELQLEGALVLLDPPRRAVLNRTVRRAAAAAGKSKSGDLVVLSPLEPFFAYIKIALVCGLFLACPIWLFQAWLFIAPGLYGHEKRVAMPAVVGASVLFVSGGMFAYYGMFPLMFDVLVNQMMPASLTASFTVEKYLSLLLRLTVAFGAVFELPLVITALAAVGIVTSAGLVRFRKYAVVSAFVLGAFLTPADPLSQIMMSVPLVLFYEVGIIAARALERRRAVADAQADADDEDGSS